MRLCRIATGLAVLLSASRAQEVWADDEELRLMGEPYSFTDVVDALDDDDPFDLNVSVGFSRSLTQSSIQRETNTASPSVLAPGDGRSTANYLDIAGFERSDTRLMLGLDIGLYKDLAVYGRLPLVLSDARSLTLPSDRSAADVAADLTATDPGVPGGESTLFSVPFASPTRSGFDHVAAGLAFAITNQYRDRESPTVLFMAEGRFGLGEPQHACFDTAPADGDRCNGGSGSEPGLTDGTNALRLETRASYRYRYFEPYGGLAFQIAWPGSADNFFSPSGDLAGFMNTLPPRIGEMTAGIAVIPWEHPGRWQRFSLDIRLNGAYVSEGHGYSPLFDALGTSGSSYLTTPTPEAAPPEDGSPDTSRTVEFYGLTDMQAHALFRGQLAIEMQAARYVKFAFGGAVSYATPYMITFADACNPGITPTEGMADRRTGNCRNGIINPHHRPVIDLPGQRFRVQGEVALDLFATAAAQF
jgi:hypothetical protein